jgi:glycosyltransferase involved in cell wall biosynthesis
LGAKVNEEILVGENKAEIASLILSLLKDETRAAQLGKKGREFVTLNFSWEKHNQKLIDLIFDAKNK